MVDDGENVRLLEAGHRLRRLVVVDEHDALAPRLDEVEPRERPDDLVVFVEDRVAPVAALQHDLLHVVDEITQVERLKICLLYTSTLGQTEKLKHGASIRDWHFADGTYRVYSETGEFLLLGMVKRQVLTTVKSFFEV